MKKQNTEILANLAASGDPSDISMSVTLISAEKKGRNGFITIGVEGQIILQGGLLTGEFFPMLFIVNSKKYGEFREQESEIEVWKSKAEKWDRLDAKIGKFYDEEEESEQEYGEQEFGDGNLLDIGEAAASAFGYL